MKGSQIRHESGIQNGNFVSKYFESETFRLCKQRIPRIRIV